MIPYSNHYISLSLNHYLQVADTVAWSEAFVSQLSSARHAASACPATAPEIEP